MLQAQVPLVKTLEVSYFLSQLESFQFHLGDLEIFVITSAGLFASVLAAMDALLRMTSVVDGALGFVECNAMHIALTLFHISTHCHF